MASKMAEPPGSKEKGLDSSTLLPPMYTSRRGLQQVLDLFRNATPSLKQLLLQEADIIYECRVCKGLFRGLVNFIEHKRSYCKLQSGIDQHCATKTLGLNMRDLFPNEDAVAPQVEPQPPTGSPGNVREASKKNLAAPVINDQSSEVGNANAYLILRPIPNTTEAIEQQVVRSDHIVHHDDLEKMSVFAPKPDRGDTAKIVGEIAIRQATKNARTSRVEKRETLHNLVKGFGGKSCSRRELFEEEESSKEPKSPIGKDAEGGRKSGNPKKVIGLAVRPGSALQEPKEKNLPGAVACQPTECQICKKKCKNWTALAWHMRIHKRPIFKCSLCRYSSVSVYNLRRHMQTMHHLPTTRVDELLSRKVEQQKILHEGREKEAMKQGEGSSLPTCDICFKTFANRRNVLRHKEIHRREQLGSDLNRGNVPQTPSREEIARNKVMQIMDEKKLKCRRCQKQLSTMRRLQQHCCNHFGFNRYRCMLCPYENNDYTQMRRHMMGKHGRQFRTIHQISEAIRNMKIGIWVNLVQNGNGSTNDEVGPSPRKSKDVNDSKMTAVKGKYDHVVTPKIVELADMDDTSDLNGNDVEMEDSALEMDNQDEIEDEEEDGEEELDDDEDDDEEEGEEEEEEEDEEGEEEEEVENEKQPVASNKDPVKNEGKSGKSQSNKENKAVPKTPTKQSTGSITNSKEILLTPPSTNGARKSPEPTPSRDMPIRQARLNHQSVSPRNQTEKTQGEKPSAEKTQSVKRDLTKTSGEKPRGSKGEMDEEDKNTLELLMDKRLVRCLNCNKRYQYLSSLQRHVRIHLLRNETDMPHSGSTATKAPADTSKKQRAIESLINTNLLKCLKCRKRFESMCSLKRHVARHLGYSSFKCKYCGYLSRNYTWFKQHLKMKHADRITDMDQMGDLIGSMKTKK